MTEAWCSGTDAEGPLVPTIGPTYGDHGDHVVTLTATDDAGNNASDSVSFTVDTMAPSVVITQPAANQTGLPSVNYPITLRWIASDADGATGGVTREVVKLMDSCVLWDGLTFGDRDGMLSDEPTIQVNKYQLCQAMSRCGFTVLYYPKIKIEATDCGGSTGSAERIIRKHLLKTEVCAR